MLATIPELIAAVGDGLTPTDRRIAEAVLAEPTLLAFGTISDLAAEFNTSRPSVVRFATKLGFSGYSELQDAARVSLTNQLTRPIERIRQETADTSRDKAAIEESLASVYDLLESGLLVDLAEPIAQADTVWILSGETSQAGAHALRSGLGMIRPMVHLLGERTVGQDLAGTGPRDVAVVMDFSRYRQSVIGTARLLNELGVKLIVITDGPLSPLAALTTTWCTLRVPAVGPFDSSIPAVALSELLVAQVARRLHDAATARIDRTEELWAAGETFYRDTDNH